MSDSSVAEKINFADILRIQPDQEEGQATELEPVRTLMCAMLVRAIEDFQGVGQVKREAARYIFDGSDEAAEHLFSFINVCDMLRLDAARLRRELLGMSHRLKFRRRVNTER